MKESHIKPLIPLLRNIGGVLRKMLTSYFSSSETAEILSGAERHFREAIPVIPEVGADNPWLKSIVGVTFLSGIWLGLESRHWNMREISILTQKTLGKAVSRGIPPEKLAAARDKICSPESVRRIAERSQQRQYPDDWICYCVMPGREDAFQVGINVTQCPIELLCRRLKIERFFPYFCLNDYVMHGAMGIWLERTQTLAHGAEHCDFRLTPVAKPFTDIILKPEQLPEFKCGKENGICKRTQIRTEKGYAYSQNNKKLKENEDV